MKQIKVLVDLYYLNTALTGIKTYMLEFIAAIHESPQGHIKFVFTHDLQKQVSKNFFRGQLSPWKKIASHLSYFCYKQVVLPIKILIQKPDVLICFDFVAPAIPLKTKNLVVIHDAFFWQMPQNYQPQWRKYFIPMIYAGLKKDTIVITTSNYAKRALLQHTPIKNPIEVIYQCPKIFSGRGDANILGLLGLNPKGYLLHVGSFDKRKMLPTLVEAFSLFNQTHPASLQLVLVGEKGLSPHLDDYENVMRTIKKHQLEGSVILPGFLSDKQVKGLFENAFAYVFPSSNEGFGIPIIEAMAAQVPVLISDQEALVEIAGGAGLIHPVGNVQGLAQDLSLVFEDENTYTKLSKLGYERSKTFERKVFSQNFYQLLNKF